LDNNNNTDNNLYIKIRILYIFKLKKFKIYFKFIIYFKFLKYIYFFI